MVEKKLKTLHLEIASFAGCITEDCDKLKLKCSQVDSFEINTIFVKMGQHDLKLVTLDLTGTPLGEAGVLRLPTLASSITLRSLILKYCKIGNFGCKKLGEFTA